MDKERTVDGKFNELKSFILKDLFNAVTEDDILKYSQGVFRVGKTILPQQDSFDIVNGARVIREMMVYQYLIKDIQNTANEIMYKKSTNFDDLMFGKACLYVVDLIERKLENLAQINFEKSVKIQELVDQVKKEEKKLKKNG